MATDYVNNRPFCNHSGHLGIETLHNLLVCINRNRRGNVIQRIKK